MRARAIESQCFVIAAAQIGYHNEKRRSYGHAMIVDPWGKVLIECDNSLDPQCLSVKIDADTIESIKERMPCFEHRRNNVYSLNAIRMITAEQSLQPLDIDYRPMSSETEETPYFLFEKYPVSKSTTFYESPLSIAFTNISCVVPGRMLNYF